MLPRYPKYSFKVQSHKLDADGTGKFSVITHVGMNTADAMACGFDIGSFVLLRSLARPDFETAATVYPSATVPPGNLAITMMQQYSLFDIDPSSEKLYVIPQTLPPQLSKVLLRVVTNRSFRSDDTLVGEVREAVLRHLRNGRLPAHVGDVIDIGVKDILVRVQDLYADVPETVLSGKGSAEFQVSKPEERVEFGWLVEETTIHIAYEPLVRYSDFISAREERKKLKNFELIGGNRELIRKLRLICEAGREWGDVLDLPRSVLLHGPSGTGKSLLVNAAAAVSRRLFLDLGGGEVKDKYYGESSKIVSSIFATAVASPSGAIIFFDEVDSVAGKRHEGATGGDNDVANQMLIEMNRLKDNPNSSVLLFAATNMFSSLDPAFVRRFDAVIEVPLPDEVDRRDILRVASRDMRLDDSVDLDDVAVETHSYSGADLDKMMKTARRSAKDNLFERLFPSGGAVVKRSSLTAEQQKDILAAPLVKREHIVQAMQQVKPTALHGNSRLETPPADTWDKVMGLDAVKRQLLLSVEATTKYAELAKKMHVSPTAGALLYGPPGCGKTMVVRALAGRVGCHFINVKGPELLNKFIGESEASVREIFDVARKSKPCIIFIDEIDAIAKTRQIGSLQEGPNVVQQLLTEMDGGMGTRGVFVVGGTNLPGAVDPAIRRPGRMDLNIYIPLPNYAARVALFQSLLRSWTLAPDVNFAELAAWTNNYSGADITNICNLVAKMSMERIIESGNPLAAEQDPISASAFADALRSIRPSVSERERDIFEEYRRQFDPTYSPEVAAACSSGEPVPGSYD